MAVGKYREPGLKVFGNDYPTPDGTCVRDYIHILDLAEGHLNAMVALDDDSKFVNPERDGKYRAFNLGKGVGMSVLNMIEAMRKVTGYDYPYEIVGRRPGDVPDLTADPTLAEKELGFKATRSLDDMVRLSRTDPVARPVELAKEPPQRVRLVDLPISLIYPATHTCMARTLCTAGQGSKRGERRVGARQAGAALPRARGMGPVAVRASVPEQSRPAARVLGALRTGALGCAGLPCVFLRVQIGHVARSVGDAHERLAEGVREAPCHGVDPLDRYGLGRVRNGTHRLVVDKVHMLLRLTSAVRHRVLVGRRGRKDRIIAVRHAGQ